MKTLVTALALATVITSPLLAQTRGGESINAVVVNGEIIGQDPDVNVRLEMRRSAFSHNE